MIWLLVTMTLAMGLHPPETVAMLVPALPGQPSHPQIRIEWRIFRRFKPCWIRWRTSMFDRGDIVKHKRL